MRTILYTFTCCLLSCFAFGQNWALERSVQITAEIQSSPANVTLNWLSQPATSFTIYKRIKGSSSWGAALATVPYPTLSYNDTDISVGESYEYRIIKNAAIKGQGVINVGINLPEVEQRGRLILIVDDTHSSELSPEIERLIRDIEGDGWSVSRVDVSPTASVTAVKWEILDLYNTDPNNYKAVLLLGHVPVPYSGQLYPDGHEDHEGAWPADLYYGELNGNWTDASINITVASDPRNHNIPLDGKFDQWGISSDVDLQVGRIDFSNLPAFSESETQLLRKYLDKNHAFRHKLFTAEPRGLFENNFGGLPEGFAQNAYRNFSAMFGTDEVYELDYSTLFNDSYLWSYACGGGTYTSASGIVTTAELAADSLQTVFAMIFGSYFGDWDSENNLLRSTLASGTVLASTWAGRPKYQFEHMALGENIGYGTLLSQNTPTNYTVDTCYGGRLIHIALMGDPTLRMHIVEPPGEALVISEDNGNVTINWATSTDASEGYHVYRKIAGDAFFERINGDPISATTYIDPCRPFNNNYVYMVRALKLETSPTGSYYNLSQGVMGSVNIATDLTVIAGFDYVEDNGMIVFANMSTNVSNYEWDFGDGNTSVEENPTHTYSSNGVYTVTLTVSNTCFSETFTMEVYSGVSGLSEINYLNVKVSPIPAKDILHINLLSDTPGEYQLQLMNPQGQILLERKGRVGASMELSTGHLPAGVYWLHVQGELGETALRKVLII